jgi:hypothetical protein
LESEDGLRVDDICKARDGEDSPEEGIIGCGVLLQGLPTIK